MDRTLADMLADPVVPRTRPATLATLLDAAGKQPGRPLITVYQAATGDRVELSVATVANWVAKTANLLRDEYDLRPGQQLLVDLPVGWQAIVAVLAGWRLGAVVRLGPVPAPTTPGSGTVPARPVELAVVDPLRCVAPAAGGARTTLAWSPRLLGGPVGAALPGGVRDLGAEVGAADDVFLPEHDPAVDEPALHDASGELSHAQLLAAADSWPGLEVPVRRVLSVTELRDRASVRDGLVGPVAAGASLVLVAPAPLGDGAPEPAGACGVPIDPTELDRWTRWAVSERAEVTVGVRLPGLPLVGG